MPCANSLREPGADLAPKGRDVRSGRPSHQRLRPADNARRARGDHFATREASDRNHAPRQARRALRRRLRSPSTPDMAMVPHGPGDERNCRFQGLQGCRRGPPSVAFQCGHAVGWRRTCAGLGRAGLAKGARPRQGHGPATPAIGPVPRGGYGAQALSTGRSSSPGTMGAQRLGQGQDGSRPRRQGRVGPTIFAVAAAALISSHPVRPATDQGPRDGSPVARRRTSSDAELVPIRCARDMTWATIMPAACRPRNRPGVPLCRAPLSPIHDRHLQSNP